MDGTSLLSPEEITRLISKGAVIVIMEDKVLKLNAWLKYHPGGEKAILHQVGKDATLEINAYVSASGLFKSTVDPVIADSFPCLFSDFTIRPRRQ